MTRAALYIRVSSDRQAKEGDSIHAQREALRQYAQSHHMQIYGEYVDDGVSGTRADRDELSRLLSDVESGMIDVILITKLDRLYRSLKHYLNMMDRLDRHNVGWLAIWENYDTTTPQGRLIVSQMMSIAQFEAENTGARIRAVFDYICIILFTNYYSYCIMRFHCFNIFINVIHVSHNLTSMFFLEFSNF